MTTVSSTGSNSSTLTNGAQNVSTIETQFLTLLCTELENQNPLNPVDSSQFTSQLIQYAGLEQQLNSNTYLKEIAASISSVSASSLSTGVGYIGKTVTAETNKLSVDSSGSMGAEWVYDLDSTAASTTLSVTNSSGKTIYTESGDTASGDHTFAWDGTDSSGDSVSAGTYTLTVTAVNSSGASVGSTTYIVGTVTAADSSNGSVELEIGDVSVDLDSVTRVAA